MVVEERRTIAHHNDAPDAGVGPSNNNSARGDNNEEEVEEGEQHQHQQQSRPASSLATNPHTTNTNTTTTTNTDTRTSTRSSTDGHSHHRSSDDDDWDPDIIELREIETHPDDDSTASISSGEYRVTTRRTVSRTSQRSREPRKGVWGKIERLWTRHVVLTVPQKSNRDHFALERTFLAYIRTSVVLAMQGVLVAQLFRLQSPSSPNHLSYHEVGVPLSVACHCAAILTAGLGAHRFWKQQSAVALGKVYAGGWELNCISFLVTAIALTTFILSVFIAVSIET